MKLVALQIAAVLVLPATPAAAQKLAFLDAFVNFHASLSGTFGDEGPRAVESLERMSSSLARWDELIRAAEIDSRSKLAGADQITGLRIRIELAGLYLDRGRHDDSLEQLRIAVQLDARRASTHCLMGAVYEAAGRAEEALEAYDRAWELDRADPLKAYVLADRLIAKGLTANLAPPLASLVAAHDRVVSEGRTSGLPAAFVQTALVEDRFAATPVFSLAAYAGGVSLFSRGRYQEAIERFREAAARDPLLVSPVLRVEHGSRGVMRLREGDVTSAIESLRSAVEASPESSEAHRILASAYGEAGRLREGAEHLEIAARLAPHDERAAVALGRMLDHARQDARAEQVLLAAVKSFPDSADAHSALVDLYERLERAADALREAETTASFMVVAGKGPLYFRLADLYHRYQHYDRVMAPLSLRARLNPGDARVHRDLGLAYARVGRNDEALVALLMSSLLNPSDAETLAAIGQIHFDEGRYESAELSSRRAVALSGELAQARFALGRTLVELGREVEGKAQLEEFRRLTAAALARQRRGYELTLVKSEAEARVREGQHEQAAELWRTLVKEDPKQPAHRAALAESLARLGRLEEAVAMLNEAAALGATPDVYLQLADILGRLGRSREAAAAQTEYERRLREQRRAPAVGPASELSRP
jgi:tetratricopeptide (TPR) repeat protein